MLYLAMRIIAGMFKGRRFHPPADKWPTRPTTDFAREALFNILENHFDFSAIRVLDLFGGTGSHSYEFISRGCQDVTYVDKFPACIKFVQKTARELGIEDRLHVHQADVFKFVKHHFARYNYIFAGPPYTLTALSTLPDLIFEKQLLIPDGWFVLEHNAAYRFELHPRFFQRRSYGGTDFSFFR